MSDAQRERTQGHDAAREAGSVERGCASAPGEASLGREQRHGDLGRDARPQDESERVVVTSGRSDEEAIAVQVVGRTDVGLVREHNEDNYLIADLGTGSRDPQTLREVSSTGLLLAVCDGMGGAAAGEVASQMAVDTLYEMMRRSVPAIDRDGLARSLVASIEEAGTRIFEAARADRSRRGMGTTATVAALMDKTLFVGQVGDSRAYILRSGELKQITKDQSLVNQLIEAGQLTEDEAEAFEHSNIILQALGTTEQVSVDLTFLELRSGDRLLMCSDGLSGLVHGDVIREVLAEYRDLSACCERLIELAKAGGGHDNVTVIVAEFSGAGLAQPQPTDLAGYQQYPLPADAGVAPATSGQSSEAPTLAPPSSSLRAPQLEDVQPAREARSVHPPASSGRRFWLLVMVVAAAAGGFYYYRMLAQPAREPSDSYAEQTAAAPKEQEPPRVEVVVRTDVEAGELIVDGESYGAANEGQWVLDLPPGPHRLEARAGGSSITSSLVTVREGVPAMVVLSMPQGAGLLTGDAGAPKGETALHDGRSHRERASRPSTDGGSERRSRRRERGGVGPEGGLVPTGHGEIEPGEPLPGSSRPGGILGPAGTGPAPASTAKPSSGPTPIPSVTASSPSTKPTPAPAASPATSSSGAHPTPGSATSATPAPSNTKPSTAPTGNVAAPPTGTAKPTTPAPAAPGTTAPTPVRSTSPTPSLKRDQ